MTDLLQNALLPLQRPDPEAHWDGAEHGLPWFLLNFAAMHCASGDTDVHCESLAQYAPYWVARHLPLLQL